MKERICRGILVVELVSLLAAQSFGLQLNPALSRVDFLIGLSLPFGSNHNKDYATLEIPFQFLPLGGCLALKLTINDKRGDTRLFAYSAIVDTGSPFLTAPSEAQRFAKDESKRYPETQEQYGETLDRMQWGSLGNVELLTRDFANPLTVSRLIVGLPGNNVVQDTGGIFVGLILEDEARPTFLKQIGFQCFTLDYSQKILTLSRKSIIDPMDPEALELFDFSSYGKNIHHYGVICPSFQLMTSSTKSVLLSSFNRPVVAVIDTGLTGCVFSDSLRDELFHKGHGDVMRQLIGLKVNMTTVSGGSLALESTPDYWSLTSFKLPWFTDGSTHPHVIAMGATFLAKNTKVTIDPVSKRAKLEEMA